MLRTYRQLERIARREFSGLVTSAELLGKRSPGSFKLRLYLRDKSILDIWLSPSRKYSYHWERRRQTGHIFRFDNAPDHPHLSTHPHHFHEGKDDAVLPSLFPRRPPEQLRYVLKFIRDRF